MRSIFLKTLPILTVIGGLVCAPGAAAAADFPEGVTAYQVEAEFEDVRFDLENAILNRGLVIDFVSHIGEMLDRTGADIGSDKHIFLNAQTMAFCSADLSRRVMEADASGIAFCPYSVFVYETPERPGIVTVGFRELGMTGTGASDRALRDVNTLLDSLAREAAGQ